MNQKKKMIIVMCIALLIMVVGYAAFSTQLKINGTANIESNWNVVFTKIEKISSTSGVTEKETPTASGTTATFNVNLKSPGDAIEYQITVENKGTLDAIIENIEASELGNDAFKFEITNIKKGDKLAKSSTTTFKVKIKFDESVTSQPALTDNELRVNIKYVQDIGQTINTEPPLITKVTTNQYGVVSNGLKAYFDGINNTKSGHSYNSSMWEDLGEEGNNGIINGAVWGNNYLSFDGDDYVQVGRMDYPYVTVEATFELNQITSKEQTIVANFENGGFGIVSKDNLIGQVYVQGYFESFANDMKPNKKYIVSLTYDGCMMKTYINGRKVSEQERQGVIKVPEKDTIVMLGANPQGRVPHMQCYFSGKIYSVRIYNRALSEHEVMNNQKVDIAKYAI